MRHRRSARTDRRISSAPPVPEGIDFYGPGVIGATTIGERAVEADLLDTIAAELSTGDDDAYLGYVRQFVHEGRARAGRSWRYADITTVLAAAAELLEPQNYLEIGVRRGRSMTVVARRAPACAITGVDRWEAGYAGIENPGPEYVQAQLGLAGHTGRCRLISGDSHAELPRLFAETEAHTFDLVTVDGDHSESGARRDLEAVLPHLRIGGCIVFDDISHPAHPGLRRVWRAATNDRRYATWEFDDVGYGVALAVRRW